METPASSLRALRYQGKPPFDAAVAFRAAGRSKLGFDSELLQQLLEFGGGVLRAVIETAKSPGTTTLTPT